MSNPKFKLWMSQVISTIANRLLQILPEDLVLIGVRFFKPEHSALIKQLGVPLHQVVAIREKGAAYYAELIQQQLAHCDRLYVSFDVDSLDCDAVSRRTGTPEPDGLMGEALALMQAFMANPKVCCLEIAEVNPVLDDKGNAMGEAAWEILAGTLDTN